MALPCCARLLGNPILLKTDISHKFLKNLLSLNRHCSTAREFPKCENRVFSGIQPTGVPHIGNYAGAIANWLKLQEVHEGKMLVSIVDLHSLTVPQTRLRQNILELTACLLACGINPDKVILFQQSMVPYHTELAWILTCLCTLPQIQHLPNWKEKKTLVKNPSVGLLTYPILQAADIMLYKSTLVPVGSDQKPHIDMTHELSRAFNHKHGQLFPSIKMLSGEIPKIRSLRSPEKKMSKSDQNQKGYVTLLDSPEDITEKIKKAVTDFTSEVTYDPENRPGVSNLIEIHAVMADMCFEDIVEESFLLAEDTSMYKKRLASVVNEKLSPIRDQANELISKEDYLWDVLRSGADKAKVIARATMDEVKASVGMS